MASVLPSRDPREIDIDAQVVSKRQKKNDTASNPTTVAKTDVDNTIHWPSSPEEYVTILSSKFDITNVSTTKLTYFFDSGPSDYKPNSLQFRNKTKYARDMAIAAIQAKYDASYEREMKEYEAKKDDGDDYSYFSEDSFPGGGGGGGAPTRTIVGSHIRRFFETLRENWALYSGFFIGNCEIDDDKCSHCPCANSMKFWRNKEELDCGGFECGFSGAKKPNQLMDHLRAIGDTLHFGILVYLESLFCKDSGSYRCGLGHYAMYVPQTPKWKRAIAAEKAEQKNEKIKLMKKIDALDEKMKTLKTLNEGLHKQTQSLMDELETLKIPVRTKDPLSPSALKKYRFQYEAKLFDYEWWVPSSTSNQDQRLRITINYHPENLNEPACDIQQFLDKTFLEGKGWVFKAIFEEKANPKHLLQHWNVVFMHDAFKKMSAKDKREKEVVAVDKGGPQRQFLSEFWTQLKDLSIPCFKEDSDGEIRATEYVPMFQCTTEGIVPLMDDILQMKIRASLKKHGEGAIQNVLCNVAPKYYFAVGRFMLHAIACDVVIMNNVTVPFYQNFLLRGVGPNDPDYHRDDIVRNVRIFLEENSLSVMVEKGKYNDETVITEFIPKQCIETRKLALDAMKGGLRILQTKVDRDKRKMDIDVVRLQDFFSPWPLEAIQKILFSQSSLSAEKVIEVVKALYDKGENVLKKQDVKLSGFHSVGEMRSALRENQKKFFEKFIHFLRNTEQKELDEDNRDIPFIQQFVQCCSGYSYIPHHSSNRLFTIKVEFNYAQNHPSFSTCDPTMILPGTIDDGDFEWLIKKIVEGVQNCCNLFDTG